MKKKFLLIALSSMLGISACITPLMASLRLQTAYVTTSSPSKPTPAPPPASLKSPSTNCPKLMRAIEQLKISGDLTDKDLEAIQKCLDSLSKEDLSRAEDKDTYAANALKKAKVIKTSQYKKILKNLE